MKRIIIITILFLLVSMVQVQAQSRYSIENLQKLSQEELDVYYNKALKLQHTGRVFNLVGLTTLGTGVAIVIVGTIADADPWALIGVGLITEIIVIPSFVIGVPTNLTGKSRANRIDLIRNTAFRDITFDLMPTAQYNLITQNYQPAITLQIKF